LERALNGQNEGTKTNRKPTRRKRLGEIGKKNGKRTGTGGNGQRTWRNWRLKLSRGGGTKGSTTEKRSAHTVEVAVHGRHTTGKDDPSPQAQREF